MLGLSRRHREEFGGARSRRGRDAERPDQIPKTGWKDILWRTWEQLGTDNIGIVAAGVAYYALLAIFPAVAALVSTYGLVADPQDVERQFAQLAGVLPDDALSIMRAQASAVASTPPGGLTFGVVFGLLLTLWSASRGLSSLVTALNIAYDEEEQRGFFQLAFLSLALTVAGLVFLFMTLGVVVAVPAVIGALGLSGTTVDWAVSLARWPILAVAVMLALAVLYRYAPDRRLARWHWVTWGAVVATLLWLAGSALFSLYVSNFGSYNETYGSVGAVVVLLLWFNLTSYAILFGAELNAEIEHQTARDTTEGPDRPLGHRQAYVADTVGRSRA